MLRSYFLTAIRKFRKQKIFSVINILGLAIGISASLVIFLIVSYDFSFDKFEKDDDRVYRIVSDFTFAGQKIYNPGVPGPLAEAVTKEITGVDELTPINQPNFDVKVSIPSNSLGKPFSFKKQTAIVFTTESYFKLIPFKWLAGAAQTAIAQPGQVVLTSERAKLYFPLLPPEKIIGKEIIYNDTIRTVVAGVVEDFSGHTDFFFKEFISLSTASQTSLRDDFGFDQWQGTSGTCQLFVKLGAGISVAAVEKQLAVLMKKYRTDEKQTSQDAYAFRLQPLKDLHFNASYKIFPGWDDTAGGSVASKSILYGLLTVGIFLLLLGCVNFINLATAQATQRAKETGIRKTMGSSKTQLRIQFLSETFIITLIAAILSLVLVPFLLKIFEDIIPQGLHFSLAGNPAVILFLLILIIVVTLLSGYYPSVILSRFSPVQVLKGQSAVMAGSSRGAGVRKLLTVSQFVIAQVFIMATLMVSKQIHYSLSKDLGFKKDAVIYFNTSFNEKLQHNKSILREQLAAMPEIKMVSIANNPPASAWQRTGTWRYMDGKKEIETHAEMKLADTNYIKLFGIKLLAGKNFVHSDTVREVVINHTFSELLGFTNPQQAIGKILVWNNKNIPIVGVAEDFHDKSIHQQIQPLLIANRKSEEICFNILLQPQSAGTGSWKAAIGKIETAFNDLYPDDVFQYSFLDQSIAKYYKKEQDISQLLKWATGLAVFISCLGLLGLVIYTTNIRVKEIGVRKVLGASVSQIVSILSIDFIKLVLMGFVIATPIAWWGVYKWLQNFSYKTTMNWWLFAAAGASMLVIALLTLSYQTIKAAIANPVKSLRTE